MDVAEAGTAVVAADLAIGTHAMANARARSELPASEIDPNPDNRVQVMLALLATSGMALESTRGSLRTHRK
jgi:hypothetical protein